MSRDIFIENCKLHAVSLESTFTTLVFTSDVGLLIVLLLNSCCIIPFKFCCSLISLCKYTNFAQHLHNITKQNESALNIFMICKLLSCAC